MKSRLGYLDALRGFAALSVLFQHTFEKVWQAGSDGLLHQVLSFSLFHLVNFGRFGVILFFMTSGFVIPFSFKGDRPVFNFCVSRFFRLYPAYWFSIGAVVSVTWIIGGELFSPRQIISNITMIQRLFGQPNVSDVYWTLFLELVFYFFCIILFMKNLLYRWSVSAVFAFGLIATATVGSILKYGFHFRIPYLDDPIYRNCSGGWQ
ncbi:acyltransferase [Novosphingobium sp. FKTRR1]|uniref:acyltransferase family protein n=1 Tax=Novosphingobium sp. FKTRR1 TaxID=2879118 RepID=UPI001CF0CE84